MSAFIQPSPMVSAGLSASDEELAEIFPGDSEMAHLMRGRDWTKTPLGDPRQWPDGLKIPLRMLLTSRFEMWLGWGPDLHFFNNDAYIRTRGRKHPSMLGHPFREVWAEVYQDVAQQVERVRAGEATWNKALLLLLERSGYPEETYHSFSYSPLYGQGSTVEGLLCVVSEETESVINQRRMHMLRELGMALVGVSDESAVSHAACSLLSANLKDFPFALLYLHDEISACTPDARHLLDHPWPLDEANSPAGGRTLRLPAGLSYPTGAWQQPPTEARIVPIPGGAGQPAFGWLVLGLNPHRQNDANIKDIARLVAGQISGALANVGALQSERRRADRIWSHARDLLIVVDEDGIYRSVSPAWTQILGHPVENVDGRSIHEFVCADDIPITADALAKAMGDVDLTGFENRLRTADGGFRWISWHTSMEDGLVYGYGRDVTDQKTNAEALAAAEEALRQSQKMVAVGQLTGGIAHDFNNLLTGILGSLELMQRKTAQGRISEVARYAQAATSCANRAASLTQRLLAFSRRQALDPKCLDANALIRGMEELIRRSIDENIELELIGAPDLWNAKCDYNQLESAILNLVINARDAMPGGGRLVVEVGNRVVDISLASRNQFAVPGDYVVISVRDTGHGMSPEVVSKAFDPFFTTKPIGQGTGLGLSMIYGFARQSNGFVEIERHEGKGTSVRIYLPRTEVTGRETNLPEMSAAIDRSNKGEVVLVVEDEITVRALVIEMLNDLGYRKIEAEDGVGGLNLLRSDTPVDLLVTDVGLPGGLNGRQLADAGRVLRPDLKVLFMTGYAHNAPVGNGYLDPGMGIITKPFTADHFARSAQAVLRAKPTASAGTPEARVI